MTMIDNMLDRVGHAMAGALTKQVSGYEPYTPSDYDTLWATLKPGDVLLVEGNEFVSSTIKYLTNSTWSHAALYVGHVLPRPQTGSERPRLIESNLGEGCVATPLSRYATYNTRICRPVGLTEEDRNKVIQFMIGKLGTNYDLRNIVDLLRYFLPIPVPSRFRRRMIALGSGDPTRAICSALIAQAFEIGEISHLARDHTRAGTGACAVDLFKARNPAHPALFALYAARFRPVALFRGGETNHPGRIRLPQAELERTNLRTRPAARATRRLIPTGRSCSDSRGHGSQDRDGYGRGGRRRRRDQARW